MLALTETAASVIRSFADHPGLDQHAGLRIAGPDDANGLRVSPARDPLEGDGVVEVAGARVFLEPTAERLLADKILDAHVDDDGSIEFVLRHQPRIADGD